MKAFYLKNFAPYSAWNGPKGVAIGWLDDAHPFPIGETSEGFRERLFEYCRFSRNRVRQSTECPICKCKYELAFGDSKQVVVFSEIWVLSKDFHIYIAPIHIFHFVEKHNYLPPDEFIESVVNGDPEWQCTYRPIRVFIEILSKGVDERK